MFTSLFAICLLVKDLHKSVEFYRDTLGLEINFENDGFTDFKLNGTSLALFQKPEATAMFPAKYMKNGGGTVLAFQVKDIKEACQQLKAKGVEIIEGPKTTPWGQTVAYFQDPDQNVWEISQQ